MRQLTDLTEKSIGWFNDIADMCQRLTTGNVSHMSATIRGKAIRCAEFLNKHKEKPVSSIWHDAKEEPEISRKLFIICKTNRCTSYYVSIYNESSGKFCVNGRWYLLKDMTMWAYIDDLLEKQGEQKPKYRIGDTIKKESTGDIVTISEIDLKNREYRLSNTGFIPFKYEHLWELVEQNPAWSEEDERMVKCTIALIETLEDYNKAPDGFCDVKFWLKSLKDRVLPQPKQEWSEEDKHYLRHALFSTYAVDVATRIINKALRPQSHWKPSDEQMEALANALSLAKNCGEESSFDLRTLYEQLKKLREG